MMLKLITLVLLILSTTLFSDTQVLAISGSLRTESLNTKLVTEAARVASDLGANVTVFNIKENPIPFFDEDLESAEGMPPSAIQLRQLMMNSEVIIISSPNYNRSLPGVLKNALDWASRSEEGDYNLDAFKGKKFVIMSASGGKSGGVKGLKHLQEVLEALKGVVLEDQFSLPLGDKAFDSNGHLIDSEKAETLQSIIIKALQN